MKNKTLILSSTLASALLFGNCLAQELPEGYWSLEQATEVLEKTRTVVLDPDISSLTEAEKSVAGKLIRVGEIFNRTNEQPYQTMQLMQMNYFLEHGLLSFDPSSARLEIHYDRYKDVIRQMLNDVLKLQQQGDSQQAGEFIKNYTSWTPELHGRLAERLRSSSRYRFVMVSYKALSDDQ